MVELHEGAGLGQLFLDVLAAGDPLGIGHLDRCGEVELVVASHVDLSEASLVERSDYPIVVDPRRLIAKIDRMRTFMGSERNRFSGVVGLFHRVNQAPRPKRKEPLRASPFRDCSAVPTRLPWQS
jgi:hypothetical protein